MDPATVVSVEAGAAADGNALVAVQWGGITTFVPYLSTYAPVVGDVVAVLVQGPQVVVLGKVNGTPD
jgi:hypothetical protein